MTNPVRCVVPLSGGKDSQAALKCALMAFPIDTVRGLFCDTRFEHPLTYAHIEKLRTLYGPLQIDRVCEGEVLEKVERYGRFPSFAARHCTDELKIRPTKRYLKALAEQQGAGFEVWYGMRNEESSARAKRYRGRICEELYAPHEIMPSKYPRYLAKLGVMFRLPVIDWSDDEVLELLAGEENPLYAAGFPRVGCFPCLASAPKWQRKAYEHDQFGRDQWQRVQIVAQRIGKDPFKDAGMTCSVCSI